MNRKNEDGGALLETEQYKYRRWGQGGLQGDKEQWEPDEHTRGLQGQISLFILVLTRTQ